MIKEASSVSSSSFIQVTCKFEISVDEIRYDIFRNKKKRENQKNIEIFFFYSNNYKFEILSNMQKFSMY